tara:strand:+ start:227 stop:406 length:180 start_codon:yes stop_codon:yes gene_type:complete
MAGGSASARELGAALLQAAVDGDVPKVKELLDSGADVHWPLPVRDSTAAAESVLRLRDA